MRDWLVSLLDTNGDGVIRFTFDPNWAAVWWSTGSGGVSAGLLVWGAFVLNRRAKRK